MSIRCHNILALVCKDQSPQADSREVQRKQTWFRLGVIQFSKHTNSWWSTAQWLNHLCQSYWEVSHLLILFYTSNKRPCLKGALYQGFLGGYLDFYFTLFPYLKPNLCSLWKLYNYWRDIQVVWKQFFINYVFFNAWIHSWWYTFWQVFLHTNVLFFFMWQCDLEMLTIRSSNAWLLVFFSIKFNQIMIHFKNTERKSQWQMYWCTRKLNSTLENTLYIEKLNNKVKLLPKKTFVFKTQYLVIVTNYWELINIIMEGTEECLNLRFV